MYIKPADDRIVIDPATKRKLPPEGMHVSDHDLYWTRRVRDGDAIVVAETKPEPVKAQTKKEPS